jgi:hypothetical protein
MLPELYSKLHPINLSLTRVPHNETIKNLSRSSADLSISVVQLTTNATYLKRVQAIPANVQPIYSRRTEVHAAMAKKQQVGFPSSFYGSTLNLFT